MTEAICSINRHEKPWIAGDGIQTQFFTNQLRQHCQLEPYQFRLTVLHRSARRSLGALPSPNVLRNVLRSGML